MRLITRLPLRQARHELVVQRPITFRCALSTSRPLRLKEDKAQDPQEIEKAKQEQMKSGKKSDDLKTGSEDVVGAEQQNVKDHDSHIEDLQKETAKEHQDQHPEGKS